MKEGGRDNGESREEKKKKERIVIADPSLPS